MCSVKTRNKSTSPLIGWKSFHETRRTSHKRRIVTSTKSFNVSTKLLWKSTTLSLTLQNNQWRFLIKWSLTEIRITAQYSITPAVAWWLVCSTPDRAVWVRTIAGDIVLCSWAYSHSTSLHPELNTGSYPVMSYCSSNDQGGVYILRHFMLQKPE